MADESSQTSKFEFDEEAPKISAGHRSSNITLCHLARKMPDRPRVAKNGRFCWDRAANSRRSRHANTRPGRDMPMTQDGPSGDSVRDAFEHHKAGRYADAARVYQELLTSDPDDVAALHLFGVLHQQCGYSARAVELIVRAVALRPGVASFHSNLAEAYRSLKQYEQAAACCRRALDLQPDYPEAANNLGLVLHDMGLVEEAVGQFDAALVMRPDDATVQNNRGTSLLAVGRPDEALEAFRAALRLDPNLALARANLGQVLTDRDQPAEGLPHCQEAVRLRPDLPAAHNNLGNALLALGRWGEARGAYAEAVRLEPGLGVAHASLGLALQHEGKRRRGACRLSAGPPSWTRRMRRFIGNWPSPAAWRNNGPRPSPVASGEPRSNRRAPTLRATSAGPISATNGPLGGRGRISPRPWNCSPITSTPG